MSGLKENSTEKVPLSIEKLRKKVYIFGVRSERHRGDPGANGSE